MEFCIAGLPLLPAICKNKSTNEKCRNHTRGSMERHRRQSHQRPWRRPSLPRRDLLLVWRIQKGGTILPEWATWECYRTDVTGVSCYSSKDLLNWKFEGIVLPAVKDDEKHDLHPSKVLERPKVIYNEKTKKFVMWAHVESADYSKACAGVAVSDSPTGTFTYVGSFRPNGAMSRDQTVFVDDNGKAYQFYSSETTLPYI